MSKIPNYHFKVRVKVRYWLRLLGERLVKVRVKVRYWLRLRLGGMQCPDWLRANSWELLSRGINACIPQDLPSSQSEEGS